MSQKVKASWSDLKTFWNDFGKMRITHYFTEVRPVLTWRQIFTVAQRYHDNFLSTRDNFLSTRDNFLSTHDNFFLPVTTFFLSVTTFFLPVTTFVPSVTTFFPSVTTFFLPMTTFFQSMTTYFLPWQHFILDKILPTWPNFSQCQNVLSSGESW